MIGYLLETELGGQKGRSLCTILFLSFLYRQERTPDTAPLPNLQWIKVDAAQGSLQSRVKDA
ncbi:hypothetical protein M9458_017581, partial [Cirrhinus mrigala]